MWSLIKWGAPKLLNARVLPFIGLVGLYAVAVYNEGKLKREVEALSERIAVLERTVALKDIELESLRIEKEILNAQLDAKKVVGSVSDDRLIEFMRDKGYLRPNK